MIKVRFAPSPTGYLHIGGARTALFNYLYAKKHSGQFVLRIEDTDKARETDDSVRIILDSMKWLGLNWDEGPGKDGGNGPYFQSERLDIYRKYTDKLLEEGKAYRCFCSKETLDADRKTAEVEKRAYKYPSTCRNLNVEDSKRRADAGEPYVVRILIEQTGETVVKDAVRGEVVIKNEVLDDFVILRTDKMPIYNFVVVIDDALMGITHVIRGEDHLSNTPKQIHIFKALGFKLPEFAHIPLILGRDRSRLSKRHGATAVTEYQKMGILPEALFNYLSFLGWSPNGDETIMSEEEIIKQFTLEKIHSSGAMFDNDKLLWTNGVYIRNMKVEELAEKCFPFLKEANLVDENTDKKYIEKVTGLQQEKLRSLAEMAPLSGFFFKDEIDYDDKAKKVLESEENTKQVLEVLKSAITEAGVEKEKAEPAIREKMEAAGIKPKIYMHVVRAAVSGMTIGPGLFDVIETIGIDRTLKRIAKFM
ncbi:MAG: glutamate--tRNA ligase [bacterium]